MKKIILLFIAGVLAFSLATPGIAMAFPGDSQAVVQHEQRYYGEISSLKENIIVIRTLAGAEIEIQVDENTVYIAKGKPFAGVDDLVEGMKVAVSAVKPAQGKILAKKVLILPKDFKPGKWMQIRERGKVVDVDSANQTMTIETGKGEKKQFAVDEKTHFRGKAQSLDDVKTGWFAIILGEDVKDGGMQANLVFTVEHLRKRRLLGRITRVDEPQHSFVLKLRSLKEVTVMTDRETVFHSRDERVSGLSDLKEGMVVFAVVQPALDGSLTAKRIFAVDEKNAPKFDLRLAGEIVDASSGLLVVKVPSGKTVSLTLDADTKILGKRKVALDVSDLKPGMRVFLGAEMPDNGKMVARLVFVPDAGE